MDTTTATPLTLSTLSMITSSLSSSPSSAHYHQRIDKPDNLSLQLSSTNNNQPKKCTHHSNVVPFTRSNFVVQQVPIPEYQNQILRRFGTINYIDGENSNGNVNGNNNKNGNKTGSSTINNNTQSSAVQIDLINSSEFAKQGYGGLLAKRYLVWDLFDGNSVHKCYDVKSLEELVCKTVNNPCSNLLIAHFRLDGHLNINPLRKVIQTSKQTYLLFTPSQGDLHSYVRIRKRLKEAEARRLFKQMCETVKSCHEQGIVLRDLKLRKFIFSDSDKTQLRLESLEDAVVLDNPEEDLLQDKRGCPAYVSPEILKANTTYSGKAADMWSLGVILYTMLVGRYPFNDSEHASLFAKISRGHFLVPDCLTSTARCIIRSLLRRDPEERITSEDIFFHPWITKDETNDICRSSSDQCVPEMYMEEDED